MNSSNRVVLSSLLKEVNERNKGSLISEVRSVTSTDGLVRTDEFFENTRTSSDTSNYKIVRPGMFVYNPARINIGSIAISKEQIPIIVSPMYVVFEIDSNVLVHEFLELFLNTSYAKAQISQNTEEGARFRFPFSNFSKLEINLPPIQEQKKIIDDLDVLKSLINQIEIEIESRTKQCDSYRSRLLQFRDDKAVPLVPLKELCTDFIVPMRDRPKEFDGEIPWCRIEDIEKHTLNTSLSGLYVSEKVVEEMNLKIMPSGTVIASCSASLGRYAITTKPLITNQTFIGLVCGQNLLNRYLLQVLQTKTTELAGVSNSGTIPYISRAKFESLVIPVPSIEVQLQIANLLETFVDLESELENELFARRKQYEYYLEKLIILNEFAS